MAEINLSREVQDALAAIDLAEIDGYYVSGLVPVDIIDRLLETRPAITGITLPGMPANAPGMAAVKSGTLRTFAFGPEGISIYADE